MPCSVKMPIPYPSKKEAKIFLSHLLKNSADSDKIGYLFIYFIMKIVQEYTKIKHTVKIN